MAATDSTSAKQLLAEFVSVFLGVKVRGIRGDSLVFDGPLGVVLAVPKGILYEGQEKARRIIQHRLRASQEALDRVLDSESVEAVNRFFDTHSLNAVRQTNIGKAIEARRAA